VLFDRKRSRSELVLDISGSSGCGDMGPLRPRGERCVNCVQSRGSSSIKSNSDGSAGEGVAMRLRPAGVKPNSDAMRSIMSACRLAIAM